MDEMWSDQLAMDRGTALHQAIALYNANDLDESSVDPAIVGKFEGYKKWVREMKPKIIASELGVKNEPMEMTGTLDCLAEVGGFLFLIDYKGGQPQKWHRFQVAIYALLWSLENAKPAPKRAALYLSDGDYRWVEFKNRFDVERAKALITVAHIKKEFAA